MWLIDFVIICVKDTVYRAGGGYYQKKSYGAASRNKHDQFHISHTGKYHKRLHMEQQHCLWVSDVHQPYREFIEAAAGDYF